MADKDLAALAERDERGRNVFRIMENEIGELVLAGSREQPGSRRRELDGLERMRLATMDRTRPRLVVENDIGDYVVLVDPEPSASRHVPLGLDDVDSLTGAQALGRFGNRDDDVFTLTPWSSEDPLETLDPDNPLFADIPIIAVTSGGFEMERGEVPEPLLGVVQRHLNAVAPEVGERFGVFSNPFGEFSCVPVDAVVEPHEDVRHQAVIRSGGLLEGAETLQDAAARLRAYAERLEAAANQGWTLPEPVTADHGFPIRPR